MTAAPRVHVIALGGTISMTSDDGGGVRPTLSAAELLGSIGDAPDVMVSSETFMTVPGPYLRIGDILGVMLRAREEFAAGAAGVVVVQGTDTLEETAFVADLVHSGAEPVVFTGAMRHPAALGADGPANLRDAIVTAASLRDTGVLVCINTELHAARLVAKTHAFSPGAFSSPSVGPLGWVVEDRASMFAGVAPVERFVLDDLPRDDTPHVPLYRMSLGDDGTVLAAIAETAPSGLVLEGFGVGHVSREVADVAGRLAERIPVVLVSRTGAGASLTRTYGFEGSEEDLLRRGLISGGMLPGVKARLLLSLAVLAGEVGGAVARRFAAWSAGV